MSERIGQKIYDSPEWKKLRRMYLESRNYICERCGKTATICHHKEYITASNINDVEVTLNFDNLEALCQECHNKEHDHFLSNGNKAIFNSAGEMIAMENQEIKIFERRKKIFLKKIDQKIF